LNKVGNIERGGRRIRKSGTRIGVVILTVWNGFGRERERHPQVDKYPPGVVVVVDRGDVNSEG
jgi:hypothetical protein